MKKAIRNLVGLAIGVVFVWFLFRSTNWTEVYDAIRNVRVRWLIIVQIPLLLGFLTRVIRWSYIVRAGDSASFRSMFSATQIGFLANFTLPGRVGEVIRALVLSRLTEIKFSKAFAHVALDRVTDLFGLMAVMLVAIVAFRPDSDVIIPAETFGTGGPIVFSPTQYQVGAAMMGGLLVAVISAFVLLYVNRGFVLRISDALLGLVSKGFAERIHGALDEFADGLRVFRSPADMGKALFWSFVTWGTFLLVSICMMQAFDLEWPWYTPFVMNTILAVFIAAPGLPGFVGQYHVPLVITLVMLSPGIDVDQAKAFAILTHLIQLPPIAILGVYCLATERLGVRELISAGEDAQENAEKA